MGAAQVTHLVRLLRVVEAVAVQGVVERTVTTHTAMVVSVLLTPSQDQPLVNWSAVSIGLLAVVGVAITMVLVVAELEQQGRVVAVVVQERCLLRQDKQIPAVVVAVEVSLAQVLAAAQAWLLFLTQALNKERAVL
jgi:hypothetical protein